MERIIDIPHLPKGEVRCLIIGEKYRNSLEKALLQHSIKVICAENNDFVDERLSGHIDLSMLHLGNNTIAALDYLRDGEIIHKLAALGFEPDFMPNPNGKAYPHDAALNICIIDDYVICNTRTANERLINGRKIISCNQGYTKCSTVVVDEHSIITSDRFIAENAALHGIQALLINDSFVKLQGFKKGFIGGATFKLSRNKLAFTGVIPDVNAKIAIENFLSKYDIEAVYLTNEEIYDIGSAIPIIEEI